MTLDDGSIQATFLDREVADPDRPIEDTHWVLDGIVSGDATSSVPAGVTSTLLISAGRAAVDTGCNTGSATVQNAADTLTFGPMALTRMACRKRIVVDRRSSGCSTERSMQIETNALTIDTGASWVDLSRRT